MTVEGLIELLKEEHPQAFVFIEVPWNARKEGIEFTPIKLQPSRLGGNVYIVCEERRSTGG